LDDTGHGLDDRIDLIGRNPARHLVRVAAWTLNDRSRFQCEFPRRLFFNATLSALQHLFVRKPLIPFAVPARQSRCGPKHNLYLKLTTQTQWDLGFAQIGLRLRLPLETARIGVSPQTAN
jgi:hypothetical protein